MSLRDQLQSIYDTHGKLTPRLVVDEARPKGAPLHDRFEWNNRLAGEAWRRQQAHELIRSVKVVYRQPEEGEPSPPKVRQFHAVRAETDDQYVYEPAEKVAADPFMRQVVLREMEREWRTLKAKYEAFAEFVEMIRRDVAV